MNKKSTFTVCLPKILTGFSIIALGIIFFFLVFKLPAIMGFFAKVLNILQPIIYGLVIAYLLNPIVVYLEEFFVKLFSKFLKPSKKTNSLARNLSIAIAVILLIFCISILFVLVVPELVTSISGVINDFPKNFIVFQDWLNKIMENNPELVNIISTVITNAMDYLQSFLENQILPKMNTFIGQFTTIIMGTINVFKNLIIGLIVTFYTLNSKESFNGQIKKLFYALFKPTQADLIMDTLRHSDKIFGGFISGKLLDSVIIGIICFIGLSIINMPYTLLVSVIVGVTNIIPFFGPYIGAIPSAILILIANPIKGLHFIIFIILLQQFDGNILGPKILGDSTGLSPFWVLFSILLFGGLLGILGMIIGVPCMAVIFYICNMFINNLLNKKNLPTDSSSYKEIKNSSCFKNNSKDN